jgi:hypothetical protein
VSKPFTSNSLLKSIKQRAMIPENQSTFTNVDLLSFANEELHMGMVPMILRHHEDYFLYQETVPLVQGKSEYQIPGRAVGNRLRDLAYRDSNGNLYKMTRIEIQDAPSYNGPHNSDAAYAFYIMNNKVRLKPDNITSGASGSLIMTYYMRPNNIVEEDRVAVITNINSITGEVSVDEVPVNNANISIMTNETPLDFIQSDSPNVLLKYDITPTSVNTTTNIITFDPDDLPSELKVGDYINLAGEAIVPQIPSDLHMQLAQRVAIRVYEALGDAQSLQSASAMLGEMNVNASSIIDNRVEGSPRKIVNRGGILRDGLFRRRFRFRS